MSSISFEKQYGLTVKDVKDLHQLYNFLIYKGFINRDEFEQFKRFSEDTPTTTFTT